MASKKVIILGASRFNSKSIEAAQNAGYYVIVVDRNPDSFALEFADGYEVCDIIDKEGVLKLAKKHNVSGVVPINDYGVPTAAYICSRLGLPGISEQSASWATNKGTMRKRWIEKGISCPEILFGTSHLECVMAINEIGIPCVLKPASGFGGSSRGVIVVTDNSEIDSAIEFSQQFSKDKSIIIESYIEAITEHSAEVLIYNGVSTIVAISDKIKTPLPYRVDKNVLYPSRLQGYQLEELKKEIIKSVQAIDINIGAAHVEIATTSNGPVLIEIGARCGGGGTPAPIVPFVTGIEYIEELIRILCGDAPKNLTPTKNKGCNYHFITPEPGRVKYIVGYERILENSSVLDFGLFVAPGNEIVPVKTGIERSGFIIIGAETSKDALRIGNHLENLIEITYER